MSLTVWPVLFGGVSLLMALGAVAFTLSAINKTKIVEILTQTVQNNKELADSWEKKADLYHKQLQECMEQAKVAALTAAELATELAKAKEQPDLDKVLKFLREERKVADNRTKAAVKAISDDISGMAKRFDDRLEAQVAFLTALSKTQETQTALLDRMVIWIKPPGEE